MTRRSLAGVLAALAAGPAAAGDAGRGRQIYLRGESPSGGAILASMGDGVELPAAALACASCHGRRGEGRSEGGIAPPSLAWEHLTRPYGVTGEGWRSHPPYTARSLARAITEGIDPGGNPLHVAMPRYRMPDADLRDLIAFLRRLGRIPDPGVGEKKVVVGTFLPADGPGAAAGRDMFAVLKAQFEQVNAAGGVYGRRIELRKFRSAAEVGGIFALVGGIPGGLVDLASLAESNGVPLVAPLSGGASEGGRFVFRLFPGKREQALALAAFAERLLPRERLSALVIHPAAAEDEAAAQAVRHRATREGWAALRVLAYGAGGFDAAQAAGEAALSGSTAVFFLGEAAELGAFLTEAARRELAPTLFAEGEAVGRGLFAIPRAFRGEVHLAFPSGPPRPGSGEGRAFHALADRLGLSPERRAFQVRAYAAGRVLIEALRAAGRRLDRDRLVLALEGLDDLDAGPPQPIRFGPLRHVGLAGASIARLDPAGGRLVPEREWESADP